MLNYSSITILFRFFFKISNNYYKRDNFFPIYFYCISLENHRKRDKFDRGFKGLLDEFLLHLPYKFKTNHMKTVKL